MQKKAFDPSSSPLYPSSSPLPLYPFNRWGAVILAAGQGRRMGEPKWKLKMSDGLTILQKQWNAFHTAGAHEIRVVVHKSQFEEIALLIPKSNLIVNSESDSEQFYSLQLGIHSLIEKNFSGIFIQPVDCPALNESLIKVLIEKIKKAPNKPFKPVTKGKGGHPIWIPKNPWWKRIMEYKGQGGLREIISYDDFEKITLDEIPTNIDLDTQEDFIEWKKTQ